jgi:glycosyltransferase involved in cell wall biosynthesis
MMKISILLATYNWPEALSLCLESLEKQTAKNFEVIIADDGSGSKTKELIEQFIKNSKLSIRHLWQDDLGFRKTLILNQAIEVASGEYLVFLDGDCIVQPDFIERHRRLAQIGFLVTGSRVLLSESLSKKILAWPHWNFSAFQSNLITYRLNGGINKFWPIVIKLGNGSWRIYKKFVWRRIKGCNMACWKQDAVKIGGFDETMTGWGHEDADFVFRLQHSGIQRKSGAWSTEVFHLFHRISDQSKAEENAKRVREKIMAKVNGSL